MSDGPHRVSIEARLEEGRRIRDKDAFSPTIRDKSTAAVVDDSRVDVPEIWRGPFDISAKIAVRHRRASIWKPCAVKPQDILAHLLIDCAIRSRAKARPAPRPPKRRRALAIWAQGHPPDRRTLLLQVHAGTRATYGLASSKAWRACSSTHSPASS